MARAIAPHGHLYTYEFHQGRADEARADFARHKIDSIVTVTCRDACGEGFTLNQNSADAVRCTLSSPLPLSRSPLLDSVPSCLTLRGLPGPPTALASARKC